jgi:hypothetical protein
VEALRVRRVSAYVLCTEEYADQLADQLGALICPDQSHEGPCPVPHQLITTALGKKKSKFWRAWFDEPSRQDAASG